MCKKNDQGKPKNGQKEPKGLKSAYTIKKARCVLVALLLLTAIITPIVSMAIILPCLRWWSNLPFFQWWGKFIGVNDVEGLLPDFLGGFIGLIFGFAFDAFFIRKLVVLKQAEGILRVLRHEANAIEGTNAIIIPKHDLCVPEIGIWAIDNILSEEENTSLILNMPLSQNKWYNRILFRKDDRGDGYGYEIVDELRELNTAIKRYNNDFARLPKEAVKERYELCVKYSIHVQIKTDIAEQDKLTFSGVEVGYKHDKENYEICVGGNNYILSNDSKEESKSDIFCIRLDSKATDTVDGGSGKSETSESKQVNQTKPKDSEFECNNNIPKCVKKLLGSINQIVGGK